MYTFMWFIINLVFAMGSKNATIHNAFQNITTNHPSQYNADDSNHIIQFKEFCSESNISALAYPNNKMNTIFVSFKLIDMKFKDCFEYFFIFLVYRKRKVREHKVWNIYGRENKMSYVFENVTCGLYEVIIQPCYNKSECALMIVRYPKPINMTSNDCISDLPESLSSKSIIPMGFNIESGVIMLAATSIIIIIAVSGWIYYHYYYHHHHHPPGNPVIPSPIRLQRPTNSIRVYILHFYNKNKVMKNQVKIMKEFLLNSSDFISVKEIHDELAEILFDANQWLHNMLEIKDKDGSIKKIIFIDSEECEDEEYELENLIFCEFIEKLSNNVNRCRTDYECLFIVRLDDVNTNSERIKKLHRTVHYCIPNHLNALYLNLKTISELDIYN